MPESLHRYVPYALLAVFFVVDKRPPVSVSGHRGKIDDAHEEWTADVVNCA
jgi:hypothetical protein